jgi:ATP-binding cassette subfamily C protein CydCD
LGAALLAVAQAWLLATAINSAFVDGADLAALQTTLIALGVVLGTRAAIGWAQESVARRCSSAVKSNLRMRLLRHAATPLPGSLDTTPSGEVVTLATRGLDALDAYFARYLPQLVLAGIVPVVVVICLAFADGVAAITVALTVPLIPLFMALIGSATERRRRRRWDALARLSGHFLDVVAGLPTLRAFGRAGVQLGRLERVTDDYRRESLATLRVAFLSAFALELAATLSVALVAVGVALRLVDGSMAFRTGLFVLILAPEAYLPLRQLGASFHASEEGLAAAGEVFRIIETGPRPQTGPRGSRSSTAGETVSGIRAPACGAIRVKGVTVSQTGRALEAPSLATFEVRRGEVVALAGPSGVGKSTLIDVILGLRPADSGDVIVVPSDAAVPAMDVATLDIESWHRRVAWVPQHPYCFAGTVAANARLATPDASDASVREALAAVGLHDVDPGMQLGEGGTGLSSGQRRRLGVARALLKDADVLILDEPTAGLDSEAEATVLAAVRAAADVKRQIVLLVAHRPAALAIAHTTVTVVSRRGDPL